MKRNTFQPKFKFFNNEKPKKSIGDFSIESDSFNDSLEKQNNNINNEFSFEFPKEKNITSINISNNIDENRTENKIYSINISSNKNSLKDNIKNDFKNKIEDFNMIKHSTWTKENNRYSNISEIYNNNLRFLSSCESDFREEDDDIVNITTHEINFHNTINDLSNDYIKGFNAMYNYNNDNQFEILLQPEISKIYNSGEIDGLTNENIINIENSYIPTKNENKKNIEFNNSINEKNKNKSEKDKYNNKSNNKEINIYLIEHKYNIINNKENNLNEAKNKIQDLRDSKKFFESQNRKKTLTILSLTKHNKIFQKFLCVSIDTSGLYSLDNDMKVLLLNPKITYNYPFNKMERELD